MNMPVIIIVMEPVIAASGGMQTVAVAETKPVAVVSLERFEAGRASRKG